MDKCSLWAEEGGLSRRDARSAEGTSSPLPDKRRDGVRTSIWFDSLSAWNRGPELFMWSVCGGGWMLAMLLDLDEAPCAFRLSPAKQSKR